MTDNKSAFAVNQYDENVRKVIPFYDEIYEQIFSVIHPYFVRELKKGYIVIGDHRHFHGCTLFLYKEHVDKTELFHLDKAELAHFMEEMKAMLSAAQDKNIEGSSIMTDSMTTGSGHEAPSLSNNFNKHIFRFR